MSPRPRFYPPPLLCSLFCCLVGGPLARFFQQQSMSRPWSLFSSSAGSLREMCMVSLISRWWCGLHGQGSMSPPREAGGVETRCALRLQIFLSLLFLWLPGAPSNTSPVPSLFPQCTFAHNRRGSRKPLHRPKYVSILQLHNVMACLFLMDMAAFEQLLPSTHTAAVS